MPPELSDEHAAAICRVLIDHGVQFVIIGGMAPRLHDTGHATIDVDICPSTDDANLARLAPALSDLGARLRVSGDPEGYASLSEHASVIEIAAVDVPVASLEDVVASKRAAGRPKDIVALTPLEARLRRP
jgi:predicted nucleotidyltransferase